MREYSCFDIIGPIMVGPSSSHTAGAVRLGRLARSIIGGLPKKVEIFLHGSFAQTYRGHGTDLALIGGLLGLNTADPQISNSFTKAKEEGLDFKFIPTDLGEEVHPNTVKFIITNRADEELTIMGSSIGGGSVVITQLNGNEIELKGDLPTIITTHHDIPGVISRVSQILANYKINIAFMRVFRKEKRKLANMIVETDENVQAEIIKEILALEPVVNVSFIEPV